MLFGDILAVNATDRLLIYASGASIILLMVVMWRALVSATVHEDLARAEGVQVEKINILLMLCIALSVATAMKEVGILLVAALLIIPASTARAFSRTPEQMALCASVIGGVSVAGGLMLSLNFDTPPGPSIVTGTLLLFAISAATRSLRS